jgi:hypothetical protein
MGGGTFPGRIEWCACESWWGSDLPLRSDSGVKVVSREENPWCERVALQDGESKVAAEFMALSCTR